MKQIGIQELRQLQLGLTDSIDAFCKEKGLRYSLSGGSLLGAVRHKGFIPWDDDVDVLMPRPDYERFIQEFNGTHPYYRVENYRNVPDYPVIFSKLVDKRTKLKERKNSMICFGVFVDLFAVDGQPSDYNEFETFEKEYAHLSKQYHNSAPMYKYTTDPTVMVKTFVRGLFYPKLQKTAEKIEAHLAKYPFETSKYAGALMGGSGLGTHVPTEVFKHYTRMKFEDREYSCIEDYDTYLTTMYGDYMTPPPVSKQKAPHFNTVWWINEK